ncbi:hypothetical protein Pelo_12569 [Pelomyxa schiedti]|nr:hypothetical protein Pelo_12569 [Pelomyxa schiedti]
MSGGNVHVEDLTSPLSTPSITPSSSPSVTQLIGISRLTPGSQNKQTTANQGLSPVAANKTSNAPPPAKMYIQQPQFPNSEDELNTRITTQERVKELKKELSACKSSIGLLHTGLSTNTRQTSSLKLELSELRDLQNALFSRQVRMIEEIVAYTTNSYLSRLGVILPRQGMAAQGTPTPLQCDAADSIHRFLFTTANNNNSESTLRAETDMITEKKISDAVNVLHHQVAVALESTNANISELRGEIDGRVNEEQLGATDQRVKEISTEVEKWRTDMVQSQKKLEKENAKLRKKIEGVLGHMQKMESGSKKSTTIIPLEDSNPEGKPLPPIPQPSPDTKLPVQEPEAVLAPAPVPPTTLPPITLPPTPLPTILLPSTPLPPTPSPSDLETRLLLLEQKVTQELLGLSSAMEDIKKNEISTNDHISEIKNSLAKVEASSIRQTSDQQMQILKQNIATCIAATNDFDRRIEETCHPIGDNVEKLTRDIQNLVHFKDDQKSKVDGLNKQLAQFQDSFTEKMDSISSDISGISQIAEGTKTRASHQAQILSDLQKNLAEAICRITQLDEQQGEYLRNFESKTASAVATNVSETKRLSDVITQHQKQIEDVTQNVSSLTKNTATIIPELKKQIADATSHFSEITKEITDSAVQTLAPDIKRQVGDSVMQGVGAEIKKQVVDNVAQSSTQIMNEIRRQVLEVESHNNEQSADFRRQLTDLQTNANIQGGELRKGVVESVGELRKQMIDNINDLRKQFTESITQQNSNVGELKDEVRQAEQRIGKQNSSQQEVHRQVTELLGKVQEIGSNIQPYDELRSTLKLLQQKAEVFNAKTVQQQIDDAISRQVVQFDALSDSVKRLERKLLVECVPEIQKQLADASSQSSAHDNELRLFVRKQIGEALNYHSDKLSETEVSMKSLEKKILTEVVRVHDSLKELVDQHNTQLEKLSSQVKKQGKKVSKLESERPEESSTQIAEVQEALLKIHPKPQDSSLKEVTMLTCKYDELKTKVDSLASSLDYVSKSCQSLDAKQPLIQTLTSQLQDLRGEVALVRSLQTPLSTNPPVANQQVQALSDAITQLSSANSLASQRDNLKSLELQVESLKAQCSCIKSLQDSVAEHSYAVKQHEDALTALNLGNKAINKLHTKILDEISTLKKDLDSLHQQCAFSEEKSRSAMEVVSQQIHSKIQAELPAIRADISVLRELCSSHSKSIESHRNTIHELNASIASGLSAQNAYNTSRSEQVNPILKWANKFLTLNRVAHMECSKEVSKPDSQFGLHEAVKVLKELQAIQQVGPTQEASPPQPQGNVKSPKTQQSKVLSPIESDVSAEVSKIIDLIETPSGNLAFGEDLPQPRNAKTNQRRKNRSRHKSHPLHQSQILVSSTDEIEPSLTHFGSDKSDSILYKNGDYPKDATGKSLGDEVDELLDSLSYSSKNPNNAYQGRLDSRIPQEKSPHPSTNFKPRTFSSAGMDHTDVEDDIQATQHSETSSVTRLREHNSSVDTVTPQDETNSMETDRHPEIGNATESAGFGHIHHKHKTNKKTQQRSSSSSEDNVTPRLASDNQSSESQASHSLFNNLQPSSLPQPPSDQAIQPHPNILGYPLQEGNEAKPDHLLVVVPQTDFSQLPPLQSVPQTVPSLPPSPTLQLVVVPQTETLPPIRQENYGPISSQKPIQFPPQNQVPVAAPPCTEEQPSPVQRNEENTMQPSQSVAPKQLQEQMQQLQQQIQKLQSHLPPLQPGSENVPKEDSAVNTPSEDKDSISSKEFSRNSKASGSQSSSGASKKGNKYPSTESKRNSRASQQSSASAAQAFCGVPGAGDSTAAIGGSSSARGSSAKSASGNSANLIGSGMTELNESDSEDLLGSFCASIEEDSQAEKGLMDDVTEISLLEESFIESSAKSSAKHTGPQPGKSSRSEDLDEEDNEEDQIEFVEEEYSKPDKFHSDDDDDDAGNGACAKRPTPNAPNQGFGTQPTSSKGSSDERGGKNHGSVTEMENFPDEEIEPTVDSVRQFRDESLEPSHSYGHLTKSYGSLSPREFNFFDRSGSTLEPSVTSNIASSSNISPSDYGSQFASGNFTANERAQNSVLSTSARLSTFSTTIHNSIDLAAESALERSYSLLKETSGSAGPLSSDGSSTSSMETKAILPPGGSASSEPSESGDLIGTVDPLDEHSQTASIEVPDELFQTSISGQDFSPTNSVNTKHHKHRSTHSKTSSRSGNKLGRMSSADKTKDAPLYEIRSGQSTTQKFMQGQREGTSTNYLVASSPFDQTSQMNTHESSKPHSYTKSNLKERGVSSKASNDPDSNVQRALLDVQLTNSYASLERSDYQSLVSVPDCEDSTNTDDLVSHCGSLEPSSTSFFESINTVEANLDSSRNTQKQDSIRGKVESPDHSNTGDEEDALNSYNTSTVVSKSIFNVGTASLANELCFSNPPSSFTPKTSSGTLFSQVPLELDCSSRNESHLAEQSSLLFTKSRENYLENSLKGLPSTPVCLPQTGSSSQASNSRSSLSAMDVDDTLPKNKNDTADLGCQQDIKLQNASSACENQEKEKTQGTENEASNILKIVEQMLRTDAMLHNSSRSSASPFLSEPCNSSGTLPSEEFEEEEDVVTAQLPLSDYEASYKSYKSGSQEIPQSGTTSILPLGSHGDSFQCKSKTRSSGTNKQPDSTISFTAGILESKEQVSSQSNWVSSTLVESNDYHESMDPLFIAGYPGDESSCLDPSINTQETNHFLVQSLTGSYGTDTHSVSKPLEVEAASESPVINGIHNGELPSEDKEKSDESNYPSVRTYTGNHMSIHTESLSPVELSAIGNSSFSGASLSSSLFPTTMNSLNCSVSDASFHSSEEQVFSTHPSFTANENRGSHKGASFSSKQSSRKHRGIHETSQKPQFESCIQDSSLTISGGPQIEVNPFVADEFNTRRTESNMSTSHQQDQPYSSEKTVVGEIQAVSSTEKTLKWNPDWAVGGLLEGGSKSTSVCGTYSTGEALKQLEKERLSVDKHLLNDELDSAILAIDDETEDQSGSESIWADDSPSVISITDVSSDIPIQAVSSATGLGTSSTLNQTGALREPKGINSSAESSKEEFTHSMGTEQCSPRSKKLSISGVRNSFSSKDIMSHHSSGNSSKALENSRQSARDHVISEHSLSPSDISTYAGVLSSLNRNVHTPSGDSQCDSLFTMEKSSNQLCPTGKTSNSMQDSVCKSGELFESAVSIESDTSTSNYFVSSSLRLSKSRVDAISNDKQAKGSDYEGVHVLANAEHSIPQETYVAGEMADVPKNIVESNSQSFVAEQRESLHGSLETERLSGNQPQSIPATASNSIPLQRSKESNSTMGLSMPLSLSSSTSSGSIMATGTTFEGINFPSPKSSIHQTASTYSLLEGLEPLSEGADFIPTPGMDETFSEVTHADHSPEKSSVERNQLCQTSSVCSESVSDKKNSEVKAIVEALLQSMDGSRSFKSSSQATRLTVQNQLELDTQDDCAGEGVSVGSVLSDVGTLSYYEADNASYSSKSKVYSSIFGTLPLPTLSSGGDPSARQVEGLSIQEIISSGMSAPCERPASGFSGEDIDGCSDQNLSSSMTFTTESLHINSSSLPESTLSSKSFQPLPGSRAWDGVFGTEEIEALDTLETNGTMSHYFPITTSSGSLSDCITSHQVTNPSRQSSRQSTKESIKTIASLKEKDSTSATQHNSVLVSEHSDTTEGISVVLGLNTSMDIGDESESEVTLIVGSEDTLTEETHSKNGDGDEDWWVDELEVSNERSEDSKTNKIDEMTLHSQSLSTKCSTVGEDTKVEASGSSVNLETTSGGFLKLSQFKSIPTDESSLLDSTQSKVSVDSGVFLFTSAHDQTSSIQSSQCELEPEVEKTVGTISSTAEIFSQPCKSLSEAYFPSSSTLYLRESPSFHASDRDKSVDVLISQERIDASSESLIIDSTDFPPSYCADSVDSMKPSSFESLSERSSRGPQSVQEDSKIQLSNPRIRNDRTRTATAGESSHSTDGYMTLFTGVESINTSEDGVSSVFLSDSSGNLFGTVEIVSDERDPEDSETVYSHHSFLSNQQPPSSSTTTKLKSIQSSKNHSLGETTSRKSSRHSSEKPSTEHTFKPLSDVTTRSLIAAHHSQSEKDSNQIPPPPSTPIPEVAPEVDLSKNSLSGSSVSILSSFSQLPVSSESKKLSFQSTIFNTVDEILGEVSHISDASQSHTDNYSAVYDPLDKDYPSLTVEKPVVDKESPSLSAGLTRTPVSHIEHCAQMSSICTEDLDDNLMTSTVISKPNTSCFASLDSAIVQSNDIQDYLTSNSGTHLIEPLSTLPSGTTHCDKSEVHSFCLTSNSKSSETPQSKHNSLVTGTQKTTASPSVSGEPLPSKLKSGKSNSSHKSSVNPASLESRELSWNTYFPSFNDSQSVSIANSGTWSIQMEGSSVLHRENYKVDSDSICLSELAHDILNAQEEENSEDHYYSNSLDLDASSAKPSARVQMQTPTPCLAPVDKRDSYESVLASLNAKLSTCETSFGSLQLTSAGSTDPRSSSRKSTDSLLISGSMENALEQSSGRSEELQISVQKFPSLGNTPSHTGVHSIVQSNDVASVQTGDSELWNSFVESDKGVTTGKTRSQGSGGHSSLLLFEESFEALRTGNDEENSFASFVEPESSHKTSDKADSQPTNSSNYCTVLESLNRKIATPSRSAQDHSSSRFSTLSAFNSFEADITSQPTTTNPGGTSDNLFDSFDFNSIAGDTSFSEANVLPRFSPPPSSRSHSGSNIQLSDVIGSTSQSIVGNTPDLTISSHLEPSSSGSSEAHSHQQSDTSKSSSVDLQVDPQQGIISLPHKHKTHSHHHHHHGHHHHHRHSHSSLNEAPPEDVSSTLDSSG